MSDKAIHVKHEEGFYKGYTQHFPYVGDDAIYVPLDAVTKSEIMPLYKKLITKELFIEAYNKWIKEKTDE